MQCNGKPDTPPNELRSLRISRGLKASDMVAVVRRLYPKYDKTLETKCERGDQYGIELRRDALDVLKAAFAADGATAPDVPAETPALPQPRKKPRNHENRSLPCRIYGRLSKTVFAELQQAIRADGYVTMQEWLACAVQRYLLERRRKDG